MHRLLILTVFLASLARAADWPQWRGPQRTGYADGVLDKLPTAPKVLWHVPAGNSLASPIISGGKVFHLDNTDNKETLHCLNLADGKPAWKIAIDEAFKDNQTPPGPRATPAADGDRVYVQSCRGELQCINVADGSVKWRTNYVKDLGATFIGEKGTAQGAARHGNNGAPLVDGDHLIAQVGGPGAGLVCFNKLTGDIIWKSQDDTPAYAAPIVATIDGVKQVISFTAVGVIGLAREDGKLLWRSPVKTAFGRHVTAPIVIDDMVIVSSHQVGNMGIKVTKDGASIAWTSKESAVNFMCPVAVGKHIYGVGPAKNLICIDSATGKPVWSQTGLFGGGANNAYAGLIVFGENILMLTDAGQLVLFAADPAKYRELGKVQVVGTNWCNPAYADGKVVLRDQREVWCVLIND